MAVNSAFSERKKVDIHRGIKGWFVKLSTNSDGFKKKESKLYKKQVDKSKRKEYSTKYEKGFTKVPIKKICDLERCIS